MRCSTAHGILNWILSSRTVQRQLQQLQKHAAAVAAAAVASEAASRLAKRTRGSKNSLKYAAPGELLFTTMLALFDEGGVVGLLLAAISICCYCLTSSHPHRCHRSNPHQHRRQLQPSWQRQTPGVHEKNHRCMHTHHSHHIEQKQPNHLTQKQGIVKHVHQELVASLGRRLLQVNTSPPIPQPVITPPSPA